MAHLTQEKVQEIYDTFGELKVIDDIIRYRAQDNPPSNIVGYPKNEDDVTEYERFTGQQIDQYVDGAVKYYLEQGLKPNQREVVGLFSRSNVDYLVNMFALSRLGYAVLTLSLRLPPNAIINLLKQCKCNKIIRGDTKQIISTIDAVNDEFSITAIELPTREIYGKPRPEGEKPFERDFDRDTERDKTGLVLHSSGSTGLPKPVFLSHRNVLMHPLQGAGMDNFGALPLYHAYGISTTFQAMYMAKTANLPSATVPLTADTLMGAIDAIKPDIFHAVPYALNLLVEHPRGMEYLKSAKLVTAAGSRTPDELGDLLVSEGVKFGVVFGTSEAGLLGDTMARDDGDDSWTYVRIYPAVRESIHFDPIGENQFECVYLKSHPGLSPSAANSDSPAPGSWRSKDVFEPHPIIPDVWKYVTRIDDRVTLSNGEKVLPLPIEGRIRQDELVREAVVVGVDRSIPGVIVFRADDELPTEEYIKAIWPSIEDANSRAEQFSQITKDMVAIQPSDVQYPKTDKGSIIRAQVYKQFEDLIDEMYNNLEGNGEGDLQLNQEEIEEFLKSTYEDIVGAQLESADTDFFSAGIDSLKAIQMRRTIQNTLDLKGTQLGSNVIYEHGNAASLAKALYAISQGEGDAVEDEDKTGLMQDLIDKYSFGGESAIVTGATGSLGAHVLAQMVTKFGFKKVYSIGRGQKPMDRVLESLKDRGIELDEKSKSKIVALSGDFAKADLGVGQEMMEEFKNEVSTIVHLAWPVNFAIGLSSFEPQLVGLKNLIDLSMSVRKDEPARLFFASSISTAENTPQPATIPNAPIKDFNNAVNMGYAQSKLVGEHMILNANRSGARAYVLRIGQIVGDRKTGNWNDTEFVPLLIRSALSMKCLPDLDEELSWFPVDTLATSILEIDRTVRSAPKPGDQNREEPPAFYNMVNPAKFSYKSLLEELKKGGLEFKAVPVDEWMQKLRDSAAAGQEAENPAIKLLENYEARLGNKAGDKKALGGVQFDAKTALRDSQILQQPPDIIKDGYAQKFLSTWLQKWVPTN